MSLRAKWQFMDRSVTHKIVYGPQLCFGAYNILWVTSRSINYHMALSAMNYLISFVVIALKNWVWHIPYNCTEHRNLARNQETYKLPYISVTIVLFYWISESDKQNISAQTFFKESRNLIGTAILYADIDRSKQTV